MNLPPEDHDPDGPRRASPALLRASRCPGVELRIVDSDDRRGRARWARSARSGSRSPQIMKGYWNMPEETAKTIIADGWFRTGDAGYLDADGYLYIHDRVKDMIVSGGENIYPGRGRERADGASRRSPTSR